MRTPRTLILASLVALVALSCAPSMQPPGGSNPNSVCSSRVGPWYDCKTRCLPAEQLTMQCSSKLGIIFATRPGLITETKYGWGQQPDFGCGTPVARIWRLRKIPLPSPAELGYLSPPSQTQPDCATTPTRALAPEADRVYYLGEDVSSEYGAYLDSMFTAITPASPTQIVQTFNAPADGDIANAASVNVAFQSLENSVEALRFLTYGGGFHARVIGVNDNTMVIQPLGAVVVKVAGIWTAVPHTVATTIDPEALAGGAFAVATRYYVYANVVAGSIVWSVSTTAPDVGLRYKAGDEQYQFITTFVTAPAVAALFPYSQSGTSYVYGSSGLTQLNAGNAVGSTNIPLNYAIPSNARTAKLFARSNGTNAGHAANVTVPTFGGTIFTLIDDGTRAQFEISLSQGASFDYSVSNAAMTFTVDAFGFTY